MRVATVHGASNRLASRGASTTLRKTAVTAALDRNIEKRIIQEVLGSTTPACRGAMVRLLTLFESIDYSSGQGDAGDGIIESTNI